MFYLVFFYQKNKSKNILFVFENGVQKIVNRYGIKIFGKSNENLPQQLSKHNIFNLSLEQI
jgi:hypothetical protein